MSTRKKCSENYRRGSEKKLLILLLEQFNAFTNNFQTTSLSLSWQQPG